MSTRQQHGSRDRYTASLMFDVRKTMTSKLQTLRDQQAELTEKLKAGFNTDIYRKLNIVNHSIEVATVRRKGDWLYGNYLQFTERAKAL